ncbi:MAG: radical SAM protein [Candidatus Bathyarchaeia archaeon]
MEVKYSHRACRRALFKSGLPGLDYSLNPYFGCEHGCLYCYSPSVFGDEWVAKNWGRFSIAKPNIHLVLEAELRSGRKGVVGVGTVTDPYQPHEAKLGLTRKCIEILLRGGLHPSIQTKSDLVLRDMDLAHPGLLDLGVTITTMDGWLAKRLEPKAPGPDARAKALQEFSMRGIETWVFFGPVIPTLNDGDDDIRSVAKVAKLTGSELLYDKLNIKPFVMERLTPLLYDLGADPERIGALSKESGQYRRDLYKRIDSICRELGIKAKPAFENPKG